MLKLQNQKNAENPPQNACQNFKTLKASSTENAENDMIIIDIRFLNMAFLPSVVSALSVVHFS
jgi:hypothetical protein